MRICCEWFNGLDGLFEKTICTSGRLGGTAIEWVYDGFAGIEKEFKY